MNYFAHGRDYLDRPYFVVGTAIPDWLSVADRRVRMRPPRVEPFADGSRSVAAEIAAGVLQHLEDDRWFHQTTAFYETTGELTRLFRELLGPEDGFRPGFLGHITMELLLDGVLIAREPERLDHYYDVFQQIDPHEVQACVNRMAAQTTNRLVPLIPRFCDEQFLRDYRDPARLLVRLNHVLRRVKLRPLPDQTRPLLQTGWSIVERRADDLLRRTAART